MYSYLIYRDSTVNPAQYKLKNNITQTIELSNSNPTAIFNGALNVMTASNGGGLCGVKNGVYEIDGNIYSNHYCGFVGESMDKTIIRAKAGFNDNTLFRYWDGHNSQNPLTGFKLSNIKLELNVNNATEAAWISSGTKDLELDRVWVYSKKPPAISRIGFFIDNANGTNNNHNLKIHNCRFEGSCLDQDMLGLGNVYYGDISHNLFLNNTAQALGIGATYHSIYSHNHFENVETNAIGLEWKCEDNLISDNLCWNTGGIKLSGGWETNSINYSRNNKCINNTFNYGSGGIEAAISIDDEITGNKFYRTSRNGIQGSFLRCKIDDNIFTDMNWGNHSDRLIGNGQSQQQTGGIIAYNKNTNMINQNEWNSFCNNFFIKSNTLFSIPNESGNKQSYMGGLVIDSGYKFSFVDRNRGGGNISNLVKNFGTKASFPSQ